MIYPSIVAKTGQLSNGDGDLFTRPPKLGARGFGAVELSHDTRVMLVQELVRVVNG